MIVILDNRAVVRQVVMDVVVLPSPIVFLDVLDVVVVVLDVVPSGRGVFRILEIDHAMSEGRRNRGARRRRRRGSHAEMKWE